MKPRAPSAPAAVKVSWAQIWELLHPRRGLLAFGFGLMLVNRVCGLVLPTSSKYLIDWVILQRRTHWLLPILGVVLAATALRGATSYGLTQVLTKEGQRLINELRRRVQAHLCRLPVQFFDQHPTGALVSRVMSDVEGVRNLLGTGLIQFAGSFMTAAIALALLFRINTAMTLAALAFLAALAWAARRSFAALRPVYRERRVLNAAVTGRLTESIAGVRVVKGYRAEERESRVFAAGLDRLLRNVFQIVTAMSAGGLAVGLLVGVIGVVIWYMGIVRVLARTITLGDLVVFNLYLGLLVEPVNQIVNIGTQLSEAVAGLERTYELLQTPVEGAEPGRTQALARVRGDVAFEDVSFRYGDGPEVLHGIRFTAAAGSMTALVGRSGGGKSTIIGLLAGFYTPTAGTVRVDGTDLATVRLDAYRRHLGVVLQDSFLFDGTIRENVVYSRPDAPEEQVLRACRIARVDEFAERLPRGYDTVVGERGVKLSGGQRQRLSIARALLADPEILILDEATSSLDSESEMLIQQGLASLLRGRTTFVIAHRLSTIRAADQILVVEDGRIAERGTHAELLALGGRYHDLYTRQQGVESNRFLAPGEGDEPEPPRRRRWAPAADEDEIALPES